MRSASARATVGPRKMAVSRMLLPEGECARAETAVVECPVFDAGDDDAHDGVAGGVGGEVDDDDLGEALRGEALEEEAEIFLDGGEGVRGDVGEFAEML